MPSVVTFNTVIVEAVVYLSRAEVFDLYADSKAWVKIALESDAQDPGPAQLFYFANRAVVQLRGADSVSMKVDKDIANLLARIASIPEMRSAQYRNVYAGIADNLAQSYRYLSVYREDTTPTKTKTGAYTVFHLANCPLAKPWVPAPDEYYTQLEALFGPWFFAPTGGGWVSPATELTPSKHPYPTIFSAGYETREQALREAEEWEKGHPIHTQS